MSGLSWFRASVFRLRCFDVQREKAAFNLCWPSTARTVDLPKPTRTISSGDNVGDCDTDGGNGEETADGEKQGKDDLMMIIMKMLSMTVWVARQPQHASAPS